MAIIPEILSQEIHTKVERSYLGDDLYTSNVSTLNKLGYIPLVSTVTGLARALLGVALIINELVHAIFNKGEDLNDVLLGAKNIVRGCVEAIPIIGNISMLAVDKLRIYLVEKHINQIEEESPSPTSFMNYVDGKRSYFIFNED